MLTEQHREQYASSGVTCIRGAVDARWIPILQQGLSSQRENPTERSRWWSREDDGTSCFYDSQAWQQIDEYSDFVHNSGMGETAGRLMGSQTATFFFDAVFVRSAGTQFRTPFHQDEPYWSVQGFDTCSAWMPLDPVSKASSLEFVAGSHKWNHRYAQTNFGALTADDRDQVNFDDGWTPFPDIEGERERYEILSWQMEPGDVAIFNARTIHGGSGNLAPDKALAVFNTQWLGDDARVCFRPEGMDPDHSQVMTDAGLKPGDRVESDLYPVVWRKRYQPDR